MSNLLNFVLLDAQLERSALPERILAQTVLMARGILSPVKQIPQRAMSPG
jgi:hypothetical protein